MPSRRPVAAWPGAASAALVLLLTLGALAVVAARADGPARLGPSDWAAIRFTVLQAALSAGISVALAVPVARALARRRFPGRRALVTLLGAPFILPSIVAVQGLLAVFGRSGVVSRALAQFGLEPLDVFGLHGVVMAHVFFNLPLATRLLLHGWLAIPAERLRLAAALGFSPRDLRRLVEWPMLRATAPGAALVIFLICTTSFAVALTLGGGPRATTVELAIYEAFRLEFDLGKAALLGVAQFLIGGSAAVLAFAATRRAATAPGLDRVARVPGAKARTARLLDAAWIGLAAAFLATPIAMIVVEGVPALAGLPASVFEALLRSVAVALASTALALFLAVSMALAVVSRPAGGLVEALGYLSVAASPLVIGTGLFIVLFPVADPVALALPMTAVVNAVMALPFALRAIVPPLREAENDFGRLADSLGMGSRARLRLVLLPRLRRPVGFAAGLAAALSMGDLGVIALFADADRATLPLQMYRLMGAFRMDAAEGTALLLLASAMALFWLFDRGGRAHAPA